MSREFKNHDETFRVVVTVTTLEDLWNHSNTYIWRAKGTVSQSIYGPYSTAAAAKGTGKRETVSCRRDNSYRERQGLSPLYDIQINVQRAETVWESI